MPRHSPKRGISCAKEGYTYGGRPPEARGFQSSRASTDSQQNLVGCPRDVMVKALDSGIVVNDPTPTKKTT